MLNFILQNKEKYSEKTAEFLIIELLKDNVLNNLTEIRQILSKFGIYKENKDPYQIFAKLLKQYSFLGGNCCEVGTGSYPRVTEIVAPIINQNGGKLTVYEPNILFTDFQATIIKDKFSKKTDISNIDTLFAFCSCNHSTPKYQKWIGRYWAEDVCMEFREKYGKEAQIINWPSEFEQPSPPILVRESSKQKMKHL